MRRLLGGLLLILWCGVSMAADSQRYDALIKKHALAKGLDFYLVKSVIRAESGFNHTIVSPKKAQGLMQLIPATAKRFGVKNAFSPDENIRGGTTYLKWLLKRFDGNVEYALAGYNAGEGAVDRYSGVPPYKETKSYIKRIKRFYQAYKGRPLTPHAQRSKATTSLPSNHVKQIALALGALLDKSKRQAANQAASFAATSSQMKFMDPASMAVKSSDAVSYKNPSRWQHQRRRTNRIHSLTSPLGRSQSGVTRYRATAFKEER